jgi:hypothetical protein
MVFKLLFAVNYIINEQINIIMKTGIELIKDERQRQIDIEGWDSEHDDTHTSMCLSVAAACYALHVASVSGELSEDWKRIYKEAAEKAWPFDAEWFKPTPNNSVKQLVKAGALIAAEIDRLQRI